MFEITVDQLQTVKNEFALRGESVADWARTRRFNAAMVYSILNGRIKCKRGEAHRIAIELGLKPNISTSPERNNTTLGGND